MPHRTKMAPNNLTELLASANTGTKNLAKILDPKEYFKLVLLRDRIADSITHLREPRTRTYGCDLMELYDNPKRPTQSIQIETPDPDNPSSAVSLLDAKAASAFWKAIAQFKLTKKQRRFAHNALSSQS